MPPRIVLVIFVSMVAGLHALIGWSLLPPLDTYPLYQSLGALWLIAACFMIPAGMVATRTMPQPLADRVSWVGMLVAGLSSSLLVLTVLREIVLIIAAVTGFASDDLTAQSAFATPLLALLLTFIAFLNARRLARVVNVDVPIKDLPDALQGFIIVQISDIHVGPTIKHNYVQAIVNKANALSADLIAVTGDLVDGTVRQLAAHMAPLGKLTAKHGVFFVTGNHEYYSGVQEWIAEIRRLGLTVLMNEHVMREHDGASLLIGGVTDFNAHHFDEDHRSDPQAAMAGAPSDIGAKLLLAHQPRSAKAAAEAGFDLQLSGHTHGGQFFPWNFFVPLQQPYTSGLHKLHDLWVYVSRGTGYWGPPQRLFAPSEISRLRLVRG